MKKSHYSDNQILSILKQAEAGTPVLELCREHGMSSARFINGGTNDSNREGLGIEVDFSLTFERVIRSLEQIIEWRGKPKVIRCGNGPEYISARLQA